MIQRNQGKWKIGMVNKRKITRRKKNFRFVTVGRAQRRKASQSKIATNKKSTNPRNSMAKTYFQNKTEQMGKGLKVNHKKINFILQ